MRAFEGTYCAVITTHPIESCENHAHVQPAPLHDSQPSGLELEALIIDCFLRNQRVHCCVWSVIYKGSHFHSSGIFKTSTSTVQSKQALLPTPISKSNNSNQNKHSIHLHNACRRPQHPKLHDLRPLHPRPQHRLLNLRQYVQIQILQTQVHLFILRKHLLHLNNNVPPFFRQVQPKKCHRRTTAEDEFRNPSDERLADEAISQI